jgi:AcrR family transcriptional regulator
MRADARRNRLRLLEAAEEVFSREGTSASTEEVAKQAGVGIGTLFRHFPTKAALLEALLAQRVSRVAERAERLGGDADAGRALRTLVVEVVGQSAQKKAYAEALGGARDAAGEELTAAQKRAHGALGTLLRRAQRQGGIRDDIETEDLVALIAGAVEAAEHGTWDAGVRNRTLRVLLDGLRCAGP